MNPYDAVIVGAGHNGLACAALLAKGGARVAAFERSPQVGGAAVSDRDVWPGYTVSAASYVCSLLDPELIADLDLRAHGYEAYPKEPSSFTPLHDGRALLLGNDGAQNAREIAAFDPHDIGGFEAFGHRAQALGRALYDTFSDASPRLATLASDVRVDVLGSAADLVERHVRTPVLQATLATDGIIGTNLGPRDPGTGYVLAHHYAGRALGTQGAWGFVRGGMGAISSALSSSARSHGATIFADRAVVAISVREGRACGVVLADGSEIGARVVISNAHPQTTFSELVGNDRLPADLIARLASWKSIGSAVKVNLALGELPNFVARPGSNAQSHHRATIHVAPSIEYLQRSYDDARETGESREPMLECFMQTPTDPTLAPSGKHIFSIFAQHFPYNRADGWTQKSRDEILRKIVSTLAQYAPNLPNAIEAVQVLAPPDLEARFGLVGGHIFHGELLPGQIYEERFDVRTPVAGLYLAGSGTHPGGCVSGFPGKRAARAVLADWRAG
jgi:phytoene dehydrogenase-like protein